MAIINISGTTPVDDPNYRYLMPSVVSKIEGKGNGIKTVIVNVSELSKSLARDPAEVNKFFGCDIGAQTTYNEKDDKAVVNGAHTDQVLQACVHKYIEKFVLCPQCKLPETVYKIKGGAIWHRCKACGAKEMVDMSHKLCTFILAQDKKNKKEAKKKGKTEEAEAEPEKKAKSKKKKDKDKDSDDEKKKAKKDKKKKDKKKKDKKKKKAVSEGDASSDDDKSLDSEAGVDDAGAMLLAVEGVQSFMKENPDASEVDIVESVKNQQMASALKAYERIHIFMYSVITPNFFKGKEINKFSSIIKKITNDAIEMQRHLIGSVEGLCVKSIDAKFFPVILKQLYDEDLLNEDVILEWASAGRSDFTLESVSEDDRANLRGKAIDFVTWLEEDSDSDSSDSDDE